jgi:hypothetical protein
MNLIASFNRFEVEMPLEAAQACSHQGDCYEDCKIWEKRINLASLNVNKIREELREYGAWDETELADDYMNRIRIIWLAAGNILEEIP